jgi:hypothetical protein
LPSIRSPLQAVQRGFIAPYFIRRYSGVVKLPSAPGKRPKDQTAMQPLETTRRLFAILPLAALLVATATLTAQTLPATPPTAMQAPLAATPVSGMGSPTRPHRA